MSPASVFAAGLFLAAPAETGYEQVVAGVGQRTHDQSCALMDAWVDAHPSDPDAGRGLVWMADLRVLDHRGDLARPLFERAAREYPNTEWARHAEKGIADLDVAAHRYDEAIRLYESLASNPAPLWSYVGRMGAARARDERRRFTIYVVLLAALVGIASSRVVLALRTRVSLWPLPDELLYPLPMFVLMALAAIPQEPDERLGILYLAAGAVVLLWANGLYLSVRPIRGWKRFGEGVLALGQAAALLYCSIVASGIWEKFRDTFSGGAAS